MDLIITDTNSNDDSSGKAFGLSGNNYLYLLGTLMGSIILFMIFYHHYELGVLISLSFSFPLFVLGIVVLLLLVEGKPKGYALDFLENLLSSGNWSLEKKIDIQHPFKS